MNRPPAIGEAGEIDRDVDAAAGAENTAAKPSGLRRRAHAADGEAEVEREHAHEQRAPTSVGNRTMRPCASQAASSRAERDRDREDREIDA